MALRFAPEPSATKGNLNDYSVRFQTNFCSIIRSVGLARSCNLEFVGKLFHLWVIWMTFGACSLIFLKKIWRDMYQLMKGIVCTKKMVRPAKWKHILLISSHEKVLSEERRLSYHLCEKHWHGSCSMNGWQQSCDQKKKFNSELFVLISSCFDESSLCIIFGNTV